MVIALVSFGLACILPFFAEKYRYSKVSCDCFYHLPFKEKELKRIHHIFYLSYLAICFTLVYWIGILFFAIKYNSSFPNENQIKVYVSFIYYLPIYFIVLFVALDTYVIAASFIQLGNRPLQSILFLIIGFYLLSNIGINIFNLVNKFLPPSNEYIYYQTNLFSGGLGLSSSPLLLINLLFGTFYKGLIGEEMVQFKFESAFPFSFCLTILVLISVFSIYYIFFVKDPSGEYCATSGARNKYVPLLLIGPAFLSSLGCMAINYSTNIDKSLALVKSFSTLIIVSIITYILYVILEKNFKIKKREFLYIGIAAFLILIGICFSFIPGDPGYTNINY